jgi:hypothetical protein
MRALTGVRELPPQAGSLRPVRSRIRPFPTRASEVTQCGSVGDNVGDSPEPHFRPRPYAVGALPRTEIDTGCKSNRNLLNVFAVSLETSKIGTADAQRGSSPRFPVTAASA